MYKMNKLVGAAVLPLVMLAGGMALTGCNNSNAPVALQESRISLANYNKISLKMSKAQVEEILGPATSADTKDFVLLKKTTYRYEDGPKFIVLTFKNDELDSKDSNLNAQ